MLNHQTIYSKNKKTYQKKKIIRLIYKNYYQDIEKCILKNNQYISIELGSGNSDIKKIIKNCITSNQFEGKNIDKVENIYKINYKNNSISNVILIDVFHHLRFPGLALKELNRVLIKNGRIIMIEPAMGLIPRVIYKIFHYEPNGFNLKINLNSKTKKIPSSSDYFAAQSFPWRIFFMKEITLKKFRIKLIRPFSDFAFLMSGGYSYNNFYPISLYQLIKFIDKILTYISTKIFSARMLIVLEKKNLRIKYILKNKNEIENF